MRAAFSFVRIALKSDIAGMREGAGVFIKSENSHFCEFFRGGDYETNSTIFTT